LPRKFTGHDISCPYQTGDGSDAQSEAFLPGIRRGGCPYNTNVGCSTRRRLLAVATVAAAVASVTATTAATSAATTTAAATVWTPAATAASTFALWTSFIHDQSPAKEFLAVQCRDGLFGFRVILDFRKAKPARLPGETIAKQSERIGLNTRFRKQRLHFLFRSLER